MSVTYKAVEYEVTKHHKTDTGNDLYDLDSMYDTKETRFRIVSTETGEILDDAQGYGYKTAQKAYAAYGYKTRDKSKDKAKQQKYKHIRQWLKEHKSFARAMDQAAFEIARGSWEPNAKFNTAVVRKMLEEFELEPDFKASELLRVWQKGY